MAIRRYLAMTASEIADFPEIPEHTAYMFCPFFPEPEEASAIQADGCLLVLTDAFPPDDSKQESLIRKLKTMNAGSILLDFQRKGDRGGYGFAKRLCEAVECPVILPEIYADKLNGPVFLPPVPLHSSLDEYLAPWKGREVWLDVSREAAQITLRESGSEYAWLGSFLPPENGHWEKKLSCHYRISLEEEAAVFTLWRTESDLEALLREAGQMGVQNVIGLYQEWRGSGLPEIL